jgi:hypothetical protein
VPGAKQATSIATKVATYRKGKQIKKNLKAKRAGYTTSAERAKTGDMSSDIRDKIGFDTYGKQLKKVQKKRRKKRKKS